MTEENQIAFELDDKGMVGRQCPATDCERYFKLKPGTGLNSDVTRCPYCGNKSPSGDFLTTDQRKYAISVAAREIAGPLVKQFARSVERQNRRQPKGLIRLDVSVRYDPVPLHNYVEKQLETEVICDQCGLEFAVYGVFASCPDCGQLNALKVLLSLPLRRQKRSWRCLKIKAWKRTSGGTSSRMHLQVPLEPSMPMERLSAPTGQ